MGGLPNSQMEPLSTRELIALRNAAGTNAFRPGPLTGDELLALAEYRRKEPPPLKAWDPTLRDRYRWLVTDAAMDLGMDKHLAQRMATRIGALKELLSAPFGVATAAEDAAKGVSDGSYLEGALAAAAAVPPFRLGRGASKLAMDEASRIARAKEMGFRTDMPIAFGVAPAGEQIASAAINANGRIFTGATHFEAIRAAEQALGMKVDEMQLAPIMDGFVTTAGRYVSRHEAAEIAKRTGQGETKGLFGLTRGLAAEDVRAAVARSGRSASGPLAGATEPGLPGAHGVWGRLLPADTGHLPSPRAAETSVLWHRAARPGSFDASGLTDHEILVTLEGAWEEGRDRVRITNFTRPGGKKPETVIVVRDQNQLRSPRAKFDPAKIDSRNLLASLAAIPGVSVLVQRDDDGER